MRSGIRTGPFLALPPPDATAAFCFTGERRFFSYGPINKKMPAAGSRPASRSTAHLRWAERYNRAGNVQKANSHFGRALHYSGFGVVSNEAKSFMDSLYSQGATNQNAMNALYTVGAVGAREADPLLDLRLRLDELISQTRNDFYR
ncbi:MAG: hypothetical protein EBZ47_07215 [Chlamydiae bacterium]|nr:hypothetical protein [Chlamydiota bacterium]